MTPTDVTAGSVPLFVNGEPVETGNAKDVNDPAIPSSVVGRMVQADEKLVDRTLDAAEAAWPAWAAMKPEARAEAVLAALDGLAETREERARILTRENGKPLAESMEEVKVFEDRCRLAASFASRLNAVERYEREESTGGARRPIPFKSEVRREPLGLVTIIAPYNWPVAILAASLPFALIAGNCVTVKPPSSNPFAVALTVRHLAERLPAGVLNLISGSRDAVEPLIKDGRVRHVVFTGSTGAGQKMMELATNNLAGVTLELGGNDPAILLEDVSLDEDTMTRLMKAAFMTTGQVCMGTKRVYVHRSRFDDAVAALGDRLANMRIGHGLEDGVTMGPLIDEDQRDFVASLLDEARGAGASVRQYGERTGIAEEGGWFLNPALVIDPDPSLGIVHKEQFGPALPILPFDDAEALVDQLNREWAGLCSSVWGQDEERMLDVAKRLRTGTTWLNNANAVAQDDRVPFGGFRMSGVGRELGPEGLLDFTEAHAITWGA